MRRRVMALGRSLALTELRESLSSDRVRVRALDGLRPSVRGGLNSLASLRIHCPSSKTSGAMLSPLSLSRSCSEINKSS